jgi:hypothetical protein
MLTFLTCTLAGISMHTIAMWVLQEDEELLPWEDPDTLLPPPMEIK